MTTITFYSYKGGVGRSLALANIAAYLSKFGRKVFAIDLDLEAPGLHYKFALLFKTPSISRQGVVDYIYKFTTGEKLPESLSAFTVHLPKHEHADGDMFMMPAGQVPSPDYWRKLARLNWHELFYSNPPTGIPLFLDLKARIEREFSPDYLLIDARTGITEIGGIATTVLPEKLVCFLVNNRENLEGAREVLRSVKSAPQITPHDVVQIYPVLTRIPKQDREEKERRLLVTIKDFLNDDAEDLGSTLGVQTISVLHSEPEIELSETIRVGGDVLPEQSILLRDYLALFRELISEPLRRGDTSERASNEPNRLVQRFSDLTWHHLVHARLGEVLHYYFVHVESKTPAGIGESLNRILKELSLGTMEAFSVFGRFDVILRIWLHPSAASQFVGQLNRRLSKTVSVNEFAVTRIDYLPSEAQRDESLLHLIDYDSIRSAQNESGELLGKFVAGGLIVSRGAHLRGLIRFFMSVNVVANDDYAKTSVIAYARDYVQSADDVMLPAIYLGNGFCSVLIEALAKSVSTVSAMHAVMAEEFSEKVSIETFLAQSSDPIAWNNLISSSTFRAVMGRDLFVSSIIPELYESSSSKASLISTFLASHVRERSLTTQDRAFLHDYLLAFLREQPARMAATLFIFFAELESFLRANLGKYIGFRGRESFKDVMIAVGQPSSTRGIDRLLSLGDLFRAYEHAAPELLGQSANRMWWSELVSVRNSIAHGRADTALLKEWDRPLLAILLHIESINALAQGVGAVTGSTYSGYS